MPTLSAEEIKSLAAEEPHPAISLYMPTISAGRETQQGSRHGVRGIEVPGMPQSMEEALPPGPAPQLQRYSLPSAGEGAAAHVRIHGHGVGVDDADVVNLTRYFHRIEDALQPVV
jgi:hypothetical protein